METQTPEVKTLSPAPEDAVNLAKVTATISMQAVAFAEQTLRLREMESGLNSLYSFRQKILDKIFKDAGLNPSEIARIDVSADGSKMTAIVVAKSANDSIPAVNSVSPAPQNPPVPAS
jgi:hypothetical protein